MFSCKITGETQRKRPDGYDPKADTEIEPELAAAVCVQKIVRGWIARKTFAQQKVQVVVVIY